jgi:hypothetical protein
MNEPEMKISGTTKMAENISVGKQIADSADLKEPS